ncbi:MAG TPA: biotin synthase BioB [Desulfobacterales bacterium]|nr:biotin synthase BioB [Desulfobacterales bacterium]
MDRRALTKVHDAAQKGKPVSAQTALAILRCPSYNIPEILHAATRMRQGYFGDSVTLCSILNAKSGACMEDCAFCAQSAFYGTAVQSLGLRTKKAIIEAYQAAKEYPIAHFGVVTSGRALKTNDINDLCEAIRRCPDSDVGWCASLGCLSKNQLKILKGAGLKRFHHNLETAESFYPTICSTHLYAERLATVRAVKDLGMEICCGGILGMGESLEQRVELALALAGEQVDSIPLNFLIPIKGTPLERQKPMWPLDIIRSIAMFRLVNPQAEIRVCAGRLHLRDLQSMMFYAGATGMMMGPLLTVAGRNMEEDLQMLKDLEISYA